MRVETRADEARHRLRIEGAEGQVETTRTRYHRRGAEDVARVRGVADRRRGEEMLGRSEGQADDSEADTCRVRHVELAVQVVRNRPIPDHGLVAGRARDRRLHRVGGAGCLELPEQVREVPELLRSPVGQDDIEVEIEIDVHECNAGCLERQERGRIERVDDRVRARERVRGEALRREIDERLTGAGPAEHVSSVVRRDVHAERNRRFLLLSASDDVDQGVLVHVADGDAGVARDVRDHLRGGERCVAVVRVDLQPAFDEERAADRNASHVAEDDVAVSVTIEVSCLHGERKTRGPGRESRARDEEPGSVVECHASNAGTDRAATEREIEVAISVQVRGRHLGDVEAGERARHHRGEFDARCQRPVG